MNRKLFLVLAFVLCFSLVFSPVQAAATKSGIVRALVTRVVDGDTVEVKIGSRVEKVRFIGVNCPESTIRHDPYGKEASAYTKSKLTGKTVYLQKDVSDRDKYGRLLRYVWFTSPKSFSESEIKSKMFNAVLVLNGYAQASTYPPDVKYSKMFAKFQGAAQTANKGLWKLSVYRKSTTKPAISTSNVFVTESGEKFHRDGCKYLKDSKIKLSRQNAIKQGYDPCKVCKP